MKMPYDILYMSRILKDKLFATKLDQISKKKVERMGYLPAGPLTNLYKLTYRPTNIVDSIYLGNAYNACNLNDLESDNIGMIINITEEIPNYYPDKFNYYNIHTMDDNDHHIKEFINDALEYILNYQKKSNKNILVHCFMGSSRSAAIVVAYYSLKYNKSIDESIKYVKDKRWIVNINVTFIQDLMEWRQEYNIPGF
uniref:Tyrosine specific protein phosphatases domain-containing protein n=1 Tax=viral metagenome TaxID=1070528 RepID=A0A6C0EHN3_9ZZZZ